MFKLMILKLKINEFITPFVTVKFNMKSINTSNMPANAIYRYYNKQGHIGAFHALR